MNVFISGCFDVLHPGHINMLLFARQIAGATGKVIMSFDTDEKIKRDKGEGRPVNNLNIRATNIISLNVINVDRINTHDDNIDLEAFIAKQDIDYIIVGSDYFGKEVVGSNGANVIYFQRDKRFSSTDIIERARYGDKKNT